MESQWPNPTPAAGGQALLTGRSLARGFAWVWSGNAVGQLAWFGSLIIAGALLPPKAFGSIAVGIVIANAAALVQDAGSRGTLVLTRKLRSADILRTVAINVGVGVAVAGTVVVSAGWIVRHFDRGADVAVLRVLVLSIAVRALAIAPMAILQRTLQFKLQSSVLASSMLVAAVISVIAALLGAGVWALVVRQLVAAALLPVLAWFVAIRPIRVELAAEPRKRGPSRRKGASWFFLLAAADIVGLSIDSVVVGHSRGAAQLGLYALAFTLAFAPLTNFAWQIGKVIFPAAAQTQEIEVVIDRMLRTTRLTAAILVPLLIPTLVVAPVLLPAIFGQEWVAMVLPFQILITVGIGHAVLVPLSDSLSGFGAIAWRALVHLGWAIGMIAALVGLVRLFGITGAALAHLVLFIPFAGCYLIWGTRRLQTTATVFMAGLRDVAVPVLGQVGVTVGTLLALRHVLAPGPAALTAAAAGVCFVGWIVGRVSPELAGEVSSLLASIRPTSTRSAGRMASRTGPTPPIP